MILMWQKLLEPNLGMVPGSPNYDDQDCYQMHGYVKKKNRWTFYDNRFIVLTLKWMINADAGFTDTRCKEFHFKKFLWRAPLAALRQVDIDKEGEMISLKMKFDLDMQTKILTDYGFKVDKKAKIKEKRKLLFSDLHTAQNFVYQLARLSHFLTNTNGCKYEYKDLLVVKGEKV